MTVGIFQGASPSSKVSSGDGLNPIVFRASNVGGSEERQAFLRHDNLSGDGAGFSADVTLVGFDIATSGGGDNVSSWIQIAPDAAGVAGTYGAAGAAVNLGNVNLGQIKPFWIKLTIPANVEVGAREDLKIKLTSASTNMNEKDIDLSLGTFHEDCFWDPQNNRMGLVYQSSGDYGYFLSEWMHLPLATALSGITYTPEAGTAIFNYRAADNATGTNASAWVEDAEDLNISVQKYVQVRIEMFGQNSGGTNVVSGANGLTRYVHNNTTFNSLVYTDYGYTPHSANPAGPYYTTNYSIEAKGFIYLPTSGNYIFQTQSDDLGQWYVNGQLVTSANVNTSTSASIFFNAGWYTTVFRHNQGGGGFYFYNWITAPSQAQRVVNSSDFKDDRNTLNLDSYSYASDFILNYSGPYEKNFDLQIFLGPATPELIAPENGFGTQDFNPLLTAVSSQCDFIQFQLDDRTTFDGPELATWEVAAEDDVPVSSQSPDFDRPPGVWYWRARSKLDGFYGNWSDYRSLTIFPFEGLDQFLYLNVSVGFEMLDLNDVNSYYYLNVNQGDEEADIYNVRHIYLNVLVGTGAGQIVYPLFDKTPVRKTTFDGDGDMFT